MELNEFHHLLIALALGLLVGVEREMAERTMAGIRTFPLITLFGALAGLMAPEAGGWVIAAGVVATAAMIWLGNVAWIRSGASGGGLTTEFAVLVMYAVGVLIVSGHVGEGVMVGGIVAVLLHWKEPLHAFVERLGEADVSAIARLILIGLIILPVLPNEPYGPYGVINPFRIWLMVVLIVGISMVAYIAQRLLGARGGSLVAGILGGLISSTATTVSAARRTRTSADQSMAAAMVIMIASTVVFGRVLFEIALVAPSTMGDLGPPVAVMMGFMIVIGALAFVASRGILTIPQRDGPPSDFKAAIVFGVLYALVLLAIAFAKERLGDAGLYAVAALSGLTDMDAITLSTAEIVRSGELAPSMGWRLIVVGAMANLVFKGVAVAVLGAPRLLGRIALMFGAAMLGGIILLVAWPG